MKCSEILFLSGVIICLTSCVSPPKFNSGLVQTWAPRLEEEAPSKQPYLAIHKSGPYELSYLAAHHDTDPKGETLSLVEELFRKPQFDFLIIEPFAFSEGVSPKWAIEESRHALTDTLVKGGESTLAILRASERGIPFVGGEINHKELFQQLKVQGYTNEDVLGCNLARQVPQWIRNHEARDGLIERNAPNFLKYYCKILGIDQAQCPSLAVLKVWHREKNGKDLDENITTEDVAPNPDGRYFNNKISAATGPIRDLFTLKIIEDSLKKYRRVAVVYGASHYLTLRKSFETSMGLPLKITLPTSTVLTLDPNEVRPWNKDEKSQFPTPLAAAFKKGDKTLIFVGDHHVDPEATYKFVEKALDKYSPEIVLVEGLDFNLGENPKRHMNKYISKSKEDVWKDPSLGSGTELLTVARHIPVIGGEPSLEEEIKSSFLLSKGFDAEDIQNVQILQRIPYRRDKLKMTDPDVFFKYAHKLYKVKESNKVFKRNFIAWYKRRAQENFDYAKITKADTEVNCGASDTFLQNVACAINVNRDRALIEHISDLFKTHHRVMVIYGTGHFVQEYPSFTKAFLEPPEYMNLDKNGLPQ